MQAVLKPLVAALRGVHLPVAPGRWRPVVTRMSLQPQPMLSAALLLRCGVPFVLSYPEKSRG